MFQQVVFAVEKAVVSGDLRPGDRFPSVRRLSQALRINPNTAHKIVAALKADGLLVVYPGIGTVVAERASVTGPGDSDEWLDEALERLVVEARRHGLDHKTIIKRLDQHWRRLGGSTPEGEQS